jgi:hypothetical protein
MKPTKWQKIISLVILAGVLMKLFDVPYGKEVFTAGFGPYSRVLFAVALLAEGLVALRIKVNTMFGSQNVSNILRLISRMVLSRQSGR